MNNLLESLRRSWENLNERERRMVAVLGATLAAFLVFGGFYFLSSSASALDEENEEIVALLRRISDERPQLEKKLEERRLAEARYGNKAPSLGSFLQNAASDQGLTVRDVTDQPEEIQSGYKKRAVRTTLQNVSLKPVIQLLTTIENSPYPIVVERLQIDHYQQGDSYNVQIGVAAWDKPAAGRATKTASREPASQPAE